MKGAGTNQGTPPSMVMSHEPLCTATWCRLHNNTPLSTLVGPPRVHHWT